MNGAVLVGQSAAPVTVESYNNDDHTCACVCDIFRCPTGHPGYWIVVNPITVPSSPASIVAQCQRCVDRQKSRPLSLRPQWGTVYTYIFISPSNGSKKTRNK